MTTNSVLILAFLVAVYIVGTHLFNKYSKSSKKERYQRGYNYAAGALLSKELTCDALLEHANNAFDQDEFDMGVKQAVCDYLYVYKKVEELHAATK